MKTFVIYETKEPDEPESAFRRAEYAVPVEPTGSETPANTFHRVFMATFGSTLDYRIVRVRKVRRYRYDYYEIELPGDLEPAGPDWEKEMGQHAINEARERTKLYCTPALWTAELVKGSAACFNVMFRVCRKRYNVERMVKS